MNSELQTSQTVSATAAPAPDKLSLILGNFSRWKMLQELSAGETRTITELATAGGCSYDSAIKHLALMRDLGMVQQGRGSLYQVSPQYLPVRGQRIVDFGHCMLRFDASR